MIAALHQSFSVLRVWQLSSCLCVFVMSLCCRCDSFFSFDPLLLISHLSRHIKSAQARKSSIPRAPLGPPPPCACADTLGTPDAPDALGTRATPVASISAVCSAAYLNNEINLSIICLSRGHALARAPRVAHFAEFKGNGHCIFPQAVQNPFVCARSMMPRPR